MYNPILTFIKAIRNVNSQFICQILHIRCCSRAAIMQSTCSLVFQNLEIHPITEFAWWDSCPREHLRINRSNENVMSRRDQDLLAGTIHVPFGQWRVCGINMDV